MSARAATASCGARVTLVCPEERFYNKFGGVRAAANAGAGVVIVLHELAHAAFVADDAVLMAGGRIVAQGAAADVLTRDRLREVYAGAHPRARA